MERSTEGCRICGGPRDIRPSSSVVPMVRAWDGAASMALRGQILRIPSLSASPYPQYLSALLSPSLP